MFPQRRTVLRLAGLGVTGALVGCLGRSNPGRENGGDDVTVETHPFVTHATRPSWDEGDLGRVVLIDSEERERAVLGPYDLPDERGDSIREFLDGIEYDEERLLFVESTGPNACHDRLEVRNVRLADGELRADAEVLDTSGGDVGCAEVITHPSTLARLTFEATPPDSASIELTDGWGETATITASVDDPLGPEADSLEGSIRPETEAEPTEPLECDREGVRRHPQGFDEDDVEWGNVEHDGGEVLGLRIDDTAFEYGETARIRLTNVANETVDTGNDAKYNLQAHTDAGWQDVRVGDEDRPFGYTDEAIVHFPGEGFEWTFELTEDGIAAEAAHEGVEVCPDLAAGRYRFVFWGVIGGAVAVAFDLRR